MTRSSQVEVGSVVLDGTPAVPGVACASAVRPVARPRVEESTDLIPESGRASEQAAFVAAATTVADRLRGRAARAGGAAAEVLAANAAMATDRGWLGAAEKLIAAGTPARAAAVAATDRFAEMFTELGGMMAERVTDLRDVCDRVVAELAGAPEPGIPLPEQPAILLADDLAPADAAALDPSLIIGLATSFGGPTSHTAIIARQLGIPCVVAVAGLDAVAAGTRVLLDGSSGRIVIEPDSEVAARAVERFRSRAARDASWVGPGATADSHRVEVLVNVQDGSGAQAARRTPAEGVGLFRTELCFLDRETEPAVAEQERIYREVFDAYAGAKVVIRTLDAGSDKPLRFADHPDEANPALGVRGIRIAARDSGILDRQLDAIARAAVGRVPAPRVMAPMISTAAEAASFAEKVRDRGLIPGAMIEVPAAALTAEAILRHVDFLSVGTNDLAQYTMAADRMSPALAALTDPWQPAVLALVARAAAAGQRLGKPVGVCGEAAADPALACVLVGFGVGSLSMAAGAVAAVGAGLAEVTHEQCERAGAAALAATDPAAARAAVRAILDWMSGA
ncbi:putative PEP-binding protein [Nocardia arthritidis]|uniref:putative PEP-binding protein n=1 Tax=Nocardia arthritidis TaxID=228602 RepID=UPI0007A47985|nr:putative PEP-binding protein [Nocardia arthritidis]